MLSNEIRDWAIELYNSRNILRSLVTRNLFGHYKNSLLGFAWHFVTPIIMMLVYYIVFTEVRIAPIDNFWVYVSSALFPFTFMLSNVPGGAGSIVNNAAIVKKMYFPRSILVLAQIVSAFIIMLIGYGVVLLAICFSGYDLGLPLLLLPVLLLLIFMFVLGYSLFFSALTVYSRDVQYFLGATIIIFYFLTPMYFTTDSISGSLKILVQINPFSYYVEALHQIIYLNILPDFTTIIVCIALPMLTLSVGASVFRFLKNGFVERL